MHYEVLQLDVQGCPQAWISPAEAASHYATDSVAWHLGDEPLVTLRGGWSVAAGRQSLMDIHPIIALRGTPKMNLFDVEPSFSRVKMIVRDRHVCAFCGQVFKERDLTVDHLLPQSRGGVDSWMGCVSACRACNGRKGARTPEEAKMPLLYLPYRPSRHEDFLLAGRRIRADVHEWLAQRLPKGSRLS